MAVGAKKAAKELGDSVTYNGPTEASAAKQVPFIDNAVRQGYNAIIISGDDPNAVAPALKRAMAKGVKVDLLRRRTSRRTHATSSSARRRRRTSAAFQVEWIGSQIGYKGADRDPLGDADGGEPEHVDQVHEGQRSSCRSTRTCSWSRSPTATTTTRSRPRRRRRCSRRIRDLKGIISPTTVGVAAAARVLQQAHKCGKVALTGLGLPSQMRTYIKTGCAKKVGLWDEFEVRLRRAVRGARRARRQDHRQERPEVQGRKRGIKTVIANKTVIFDKPLVFTKANVDNYHF